MFEDNPNLNNTNLENNIFIIFDSFQHFSKHSLTQINKTNGLSRHIKSFRSSNSCEAGKYSETGSPSCTICAAGTYSSSLSQSCSVCPGEIFIATFSLMRSFFVVVACPKYLLTHKIFITSPTPPQLLRSRHISSRWLYFSLASRLCNILYCLWTWDEARRRRDWRIKTWQRRRLWTGT